MNSNKKEDRKNKRSGRNVTERSRALYKNINRLKNRKKNKKNKKSRIEKEGVRITAETKEIRRKTQEKS